MDDSFYSWCKTDLERSMSIVLIVEDEERADRAARYDVRGQLHQGLVLADHSVVALLGVRQHQVWDIWKENTL